MKTRPASQRGATLLSTLMLLSACMLLGAATANMSLMNEKVARNSRNHEIAFQAAEAALADAVLDLHTTRGHTSAFPDQAGVCSNGLCLSDGLPAWTLPDLNSKTITYGSTSARRFAHGKDTLTTQPPRYLIELLRMARPGQPKDSPPLLRYRITAIGYGPQPHNRVVLQTIHAIDLSTGPPQQLSGCCEISVARRGDADSTSSTARSRNDATVISQQPLSPGQRLSWRDLSDLTP